MGKAEDCDHHEWTAPQIPQPYSRLLAYRRAIQQRTEVCAAQPELQPPKTAVKGSPIGKKD
jgi:hypothetical protein